MGKRRKYSWEYKREAVALANDPWVTKSQIARELGINASLLGRWNRRVEGGRPTGVWRHEDAVADYDKAIRLEPDAAAYNNRGEAKAALGLKDEAQKDLEIGLELARNANDAKIVAQVEQSLCDLDADGNP